MLGRDQSSNMSKINPAPNYALVAQQHLSPPEPVTQKRLHVN